MWKLHGNLGFDLAPGSGLPWCSGGSRESGAAGGHPGVRRWVWPYVGDTWGISWQKLWENCGNCWKWWEKGDIMRRYIGIYCRWIYNPCMVIEWLCLWKIRCPKWWSTMRSGKWRIFVGHLVGYSGTFFIHDTISLYHCMTNKMTLCLSERSGSSWHQHLIYGWQMDLRKPHLAIGKPMESIHEFLLLSMVYGQNWFRCTLWWTNIAMENHHFLWENPAIKYGPFSIANC